LNLNHNKLSTILNLEEWNILSKSWNKVSTAPSICQKYCGIQKSLMTHDIAGNDFFKQNDRHQFDLR
jgi:hypothetical protein